MDLSGEAAGKIEQEDYARTTCPPLHIGSFWAPPRREKKGVLSAWETERSTRTHRAGTLLVQAVRSRVLSPPPPLSSPELELCCCPSAGHYLPPLLSPASMLRPFFSSPNVILLMWEEEQQPFWTP